MSRSIEVRVVADQPVQNEGELREERRGDLASVINQSIDARLAYLEPRQNENEIQTEQLELFGAILDPSTAISTSSEIAVATGPKIDRLLERYLSEPIRSIASNRQLELFEIKDAKSIWNQLVDVCNETFESLAERTGEVTTDEFVALRETFKQEIQSVLESDGKALSDLVCMTWEAQPLDVLLRDSSAPSTYVAYRRAEYILDEMGWPDSRYTPVDYDSAQFLSRRLLSPALLNELFVPTPSTLESRIFVEPHNRSALYVFGGAVGAEVAMRVDGKYPLANEKEEAFTRIHHLHDIDARTACDRESDLFRAKCKMHDAGEDSRDQLPGHSAEERVEIQVRDLIGRVYEYFVKPRIKWDAPAAFQTMMKNLLQIVTEELQGNFVRDLVAVTKPDKKSAKGMCSVAVEKARTETKLDRIEQGSPAAKKIALYDHLSSASRERTRAYKMYRDLQELESKGIANLGRVEYKKWAHEVLSDKFICEFRERMPVFKRKIELAEPFTQPLRIREAVELVDSLNYIGRKFERALGVKPGGLSCLSRVHRARMSAFEDQIRDRKEIARVSLEEVTRLLGASSFDERRAGAKALIA